MEIPDGVQARVERYHFIDVARAILMLLGIPFHAALAFSAHHWVVRAPETSAWLDFVPPALTSFRMAGFFLIAGFFAALLLERKPTNVWFRNRAMRLGVPLIAGMALIVPLQDLLLISGPQDVAHLPDNASGVIFSHLWFLPMLLMMCAMLAASWKLVVRLQWPDLPIWVFGALLGLWSMCLYAATTRLGLDLTPLGGMLDLEALLGFGPFFALGIAARRNPALFDRMKRWDWPTAVLGLASLLAFSVNWRAETNFQMGVELLSGGVAAICVTQTLLALLARIADRPIPLVGRLVDASFSIYLFHHPIIIVLVIALLPLGMAPLLEWVLVCLVTLAISYALHRAIARSALLLFVFNGVPLGKQRGPLSSPADSPLRIPG